MRQVQKKTLDAAVGEMLLSAHRQRIPLTWDRSQPQQPRCGFGRLAICCGDCQEGVCRINPFGEAGQRTVCGRNRQDLLGRYLVNKTADGALALLKLAAEYGVGGELLSELLVVDDEMLAIEDAASRLVRLGRCTAKLLEAICQAKHQQSGGWQRN